MRWFISHSRNIDVVTGLHNFEWRGVACKFANDIAVNLSCRPVSYYIGGIASTGRHDKELTEPNNVSSMVINNWCSVSSPSGVLIYFPGFLSAFSPPTETLANYRSIIIVDFYGGGPSICAFYPVRRGNKCLVHKTPFRACSVTRFPKVFSEEVAARIGRGMNNRSVGIFDDWSC